MTDDFTRTKFAWLDQVLADREVPAHAFAVAYVIAAHFLNRKTRTAWPAIPTLARHVNKSARRTQDAITILKQRGHLTIRRGGTGMDRRGISNTYGLILFDVAISERDGPHRPDENVLSVNKLVRQDRPISRSLTGHAGPTETTNDAQLIGQNRPRNPLREPFDETHDNPAFQQDLPAVVSGTQEKSYRRRSLADIALGNRQK